MRAQIHTSQYMNFTDSAKHCRADVGICVDSCTHVGPSLTLPVGQPT